MEPDRPKLDRYSSCPKPDVLFGTASLQERKMIRTYQFVNKVGETWETRQLLIDPKKYR
ncbi:hypothetical protein [Taibaiella sp. KBW10]|uniref:hypothetical protein n=1 Tax=Taibaiella sp. KBW10 TaxID=2153357 RepID=UPI001315A92F|nr:hypothetical protein [Taibaiella sp. KBW10]